MENFNLKKLTIEQLKILVEAIKNNINIQPLIQCSSALDQLDSDTLALFISLKEIPIIYFDFDELKISFTPSSFNELVELRKKVNINSSKEKMRLLYRAKQDGIDIEYLNNPFLSVNLLKKILSCLKKNSVDFLELLCLSEQYTIEIANCIINKIHPYDLHKDAIIAREVLKEEYIAYIKSNLKNNSNIIKKNH